MPKYSKTNYKEFLKKFPDDYRLFHQKDECDFKMRKCDFYLTLKL